MSESRRLALLERLGLAERLLALPHVAANEISYQGMRRPALRFPVRHAREIVIKRRDFDALLVARAVELGVRFLDDTPVLRVADRWTVETPRGTFSAPLLFAADGRNSPVARSLDLLPAARRERTAFQCRCPRPAGHGAAVRMLFYAGGYGGTAAISAQEINLCLVAGPDELAEVRRMAEREFQLDAGTVWRTIAPIARGNARCVARHGLYLLGDAARVVEPFTGEGIYYAMRSAELAANAVAAAANPEDAYRQAHTAMYRGCLWINGVLVLPGGLKRLEGHAAKRTNPRMVLPHLGVHRTRVDGTGLPGESRISLKRHSTLWACAWRIQLHTRTHRAIPFLRRLHGRRMMMVMLRFPLGARLRSAHALNCHPRRPLG